MNRRWIPLLLLIGAATLVKADTTTTRRYLIKMGWEEGNPSFMRAHIAEMRATPFDGCVFHIGRPADRTGIGSFTWEAWGTKRFAWTDFDSALVDMKSINFGRFDQNFFRVNVTPGRLDWFDDQSIVVANLGLAARFAKESGCRGLMLDLEQYQGQLFDFREQQKLHPHSWDSLNVQVRRTGRNVMGAIQSAYPDLVILTTLGYSWPFRETEGGRIPLRSCRYGLLPSFLDGMLDAARGKTVIVDGQEGLFVYRNPSYFPMFRDSLRREVLRMVADPGQYARHYSVGASIWLDSEHEGWRWMASNPEKNWLTPSGLDSVLSAAIASTDSFTVFYSQQPRWWSASGRKENVPAAYDSVLRVVRTRPSLGLAH
jgi:hypothetical protein